MATEPLNLSDLELDIMRLVWRDGQVIVPDLHQELAKERELTYATVKVSVDRLEEKQALIRLRTYGRTILYGPLLQESDLARPMVKELLRRLFGGEARPLFNHMLQDETLSLDDLNYVEGVLAEKRRHLEEKR